MQTSERSKEPTHIHFPETSYILKTQRLSLDDLQFVTIARELCTIHEA